MSTIQSVRVPAGQSLTFENFRDDLQVPDTTTDTVLKPHVGRVIEAVGGVSVLPQPVSSVAELQKVASVLRGKSIHIVFRDCNSSGNRPRRSRSVPQQLSSGAGNIFRID